MNRKQVSFISSILGVCLATLVFLNFSIAEAAVSQASAAEKKGKICTVYLTGIGCPSCAKADPILFIQFTGQFPDLIIIEYEIYKLRADNKDVSSEYFTTYLPLRRGGIPFFILNKDQTGIGSVKALKLEESIKTLSANKCPLADGTSVDFDKLDISNLPGKVKIWSKNRVLISGSFGGADNRILKKVLREEKISGALRNVEFEKIEPVPVVISGGEIKFENAVKIGDWILQWSGEPLEVSSCIFDRLWNNLCTGLLILLVLCTSFFLCRIRRAKEISLPISSFYKRKKDCLLIATTALALIGFFVLAKNISPDFLELAGLALPLPIFTFFIALVDGFNPCNIFVLTFLLALLISVSGSKKRIYLIGFTFVFVVFIIYFLFMALWLNIFKCIGFINPLRITLGIIALIAGVINCKELLFFKKGISLTIQEKHKGPLLARIARMKDVIKKGSLPLLITSSLGLAFFASLVELPCTAGFPIIYTGILSAKILQNSFGYYLYLFLYNLVYCLPLVVIITICGIALRAQQITQRQVQIIKFIGGAIMILLGIILLVNPALIGIEVC